MRAERVECVWALNSVLPMLWASHGHLSLALMSRTAAFLERSWRPVRAAVRTLTSAPHPAMCVSGRRPVAYGLTQCFLGVRVGANAPLRGLRFFSFFLFFVTRDT